MRLLDRYIAGEMVMPFLFGVAAFTSLFVSSELIRLAGMVVELGAPVEAVLRVFLLQLPQVMVWTLPMALLLATLMALSRLSANSEVVAMRAGGVSFWRMVAPILAVAALISLVAFVVNEAVVPWANAEADYVMAVEVQGRTLPASQDHLFMRGNDPEHGPWILYARRFDGDLQRMEQLVFLRLFEGRPVEVTSAEAASWEDEQWRMEGMVSHRFGPLGGEWTIVTSRAEGHTLDIDRSPGDIARSRRRPDQMSLAELREHVAALREEGVDVKELEVHVYLKYSLPLASFVFAMIAAPLGVQSHRSSTSVGFGISIVIIFAYYVLMSLGTALGQAGSVPPAFGAWIQNIVIGGAGLFLMIRQGR